MQTLVWLWIKADALMFSNMISVICRLSAESRTSASCLTWSSFFSWCSTHTCSRWGWCLCYWSDSERCWYCLHSTWPSASAFTAGSWCVHTHTHTHGLLLDTTWNLWAQKVICRVMLWYSSPCLNPFCCTFVEIVIV